MDRSVRTYTAAEAAKHLGVSSKALRLYEVGGLLTPGRSTAGYRLYSVDDLSRAAEIVALRALGLSIAQVSRVFAADSSELDAALEAHEARLGAEAVRLHDARGKVRAIRAELAQGKIPAASDLTRLVRPTGPTIAFDLPWPWSGERFELRTVRKLNYITGPLGSGKTRLAMLLTEHLPDAAFVRLDRLDHGVSPLSRMEADRALAERVEAIAAWLTDEGAPRSDALIALLAWLADEKPTIPVFDMIEDGLDETAQQALANYLRSRHPPDRPLFILTRSSAILDLETASSEETIVYCPANHSPPFEVQAIFGSSGYESLTTCLAAPAVRARTEGMVAVMPGR